MTRNVRHKERTERKAQSIGRDQGERRYSSKNIEYRKTAF